MRISASILGQRPSGTTSIPTRVVHHRQLLPTKSLVSCHATDRASFAQLCSFSLQILSFRTRGHILSRAYSYGPNPQHFLSRSFPKPALTLVPETVYSPTPVTTLRKNLDQKNFFSRCPNFGCQIVARMEASAKCLF